MAKTKQNNTSSGKKNQNTPGAARVRYLHQAATYLANYPSNNAEEGTQQNTEKTGVAASALSLPLRLNAQMIGTSRKAQVRLASEIKHATCKCCNATLIPGVTCTIQIQNESKGGKKPWADVRVHNCLRCGTKKRFPIGAQRQKKKTARATLEQQAETKPLAASGDTRTE